MYTYTQIVNAFANAKLMIVIFRIGHTLTRTHTDSQNKRKRPKILQSRLKFVDFMRTHATPITRLLLSATANTWAHGLLKQRKRPYALPHPFHQTPVYDPPSPPPPPLPHQNQSRVYYDEPHRKYTRRPGVSGPPIVGRVCVFVVCYVCVTSLPANHYYSRLPQGLPHAASSLRLRALSRRRFSFMRINDGLMLVRTLYCIRLRV